MINRIELEQMILDGVIDETPDKDLFNKEIEELKKTGFVREQGDKINLMFQNSVTWEVVYETLLYAERRRLHYLVAMHIEKKSIDNLSHVASLLLHHYEHSNTYRECVKYGAMAGDKAASMYANNDAVEFYKRALKSLGNVKKILLVDESLLKEKIGDVYDRSGDDKKAECSFSEALNVWMKASKSANPYLVPWKIKRTTRSSSLCQKIAVSCERQSDYDRSLEWLDKAIEVMPSRPGRVAAQIFASKSVALYRKGSYQEGMRWGGEALKVANRVGDASDIAYANNMLANSYVETGNIKKAIIYFKKAVSIYEKINNLSGIASANSNLGNCFGMLSDMNSSVKHLNIALENDKRVHNESSVAIDHQNLGSVYFILGQFDIAISHFETVLNVSSECRSDLEGAVSIGLCQCYLGKGDIKKSEEYIDKAINILKDTGQSGLVVEADLQLAELRIYQGMAKDALAICNRTLKKIHDQNAVYYEVKAERILGMAYRSLGNIEKAFKHLNNSIIISRDIGMIHDEAKAILIKSEIELVNRSRNQRDIFKEVKYANKVFLKINANSDYDEGCRLINKFK